MAENEGSRQDGQFVVISICPDVCKSPTTPVPYPIVAFLEDSERLSGNVRFRSKPVFHMGSRVSKVVGDEAGVGLGVVSSSKGGYCKPVIPAPLVRINGELATHHQQTLMEMNGASPEGPFNTLGKVYFLGPMVSAPIGDGGALPLDTNPIVASETGREGGCLGALSSLGGSVGGGGLEDVVGLAQTAYGLATTDWSNPGAALGAIGGVAGSMGFGSIAQGMQLASKGHSLVSTDWSNPGAALGAAMGLAGPALSGFSNEGGGAGRCLVQESGAAGIGATALDALGKLWALPNTLLGLAVGGLGHLVQGVGFAAGMTDNEPSVRTANNSVEFANNAFVLEDRAFTLGNVTVFSPETPPEKSSWHLHGTYGSHERAHTYQSQMLGPLYLPAWGLAVGVAAVQGSDSPLTDNFMEWGPYGCDEAFC
ncbi:MAG: DUF4150 domain-containing protein [Bacteroidota bacterium]